MRARATTEELVAGSTGTESEIGSRYSISDINSLKSGRCGIPRAGEGGGQPGTSSDIRDLSGGANPEATAEELFEKLAQGGQVIQNPSFQGTLVSIPGDGVIGLRPQSKSGGPAIDINVPGIDVKNTL